MTAHSIAAMKRLANRYRDNYIATMNHVSDIEALLDQDATACAEAIRSGEVSAVELTDASIARIEAADPHLGAMTWERFERARADASASPSGPFGGVPTMVKDHSTMAGELITYGNATFAAMQHRSSENSFLVDKFVDAGFVVLGATIPSEFGTSALTEPFGAPPVRNPWDDERNPGGSSGGAAVAVAAAYVPLAHGSDAGGSIRIPAAYCGLVGLKPSRGRVSGAPHNYGAGPVVEFGLCRSVRDAAGLLDVVSGPAPGDSIVAPPSATSFVEAMVQPLRPLRIGLWVDHPDGATAIDPAMKAGVEHAAKVLTEAGHHIEMSHPTCLDDFEHLVEVIQVMVSTSLHGGALEIEQVLGRPVAVGDVEPLNLMLGQWGASVTGAQYAAALSAADEYSYQAGQWWSSGFDLLLCPVTAFGAPRNGEMVCTMDDPVAWFRSMAHYMAYTPMWNLTGQPAIAVPSLMVDGLPTSAQLVAAYGREDLLLQVAHQLEQRAPWLTIAPAYRYVR